MFCSACLKFSGEQNGNLATNWGIMTPAGYIDMALRSDWLNVWESYWIIQSFSLFKYIDAFRNEKGDLSFL